MGRGLAAPGARALRLVAARADHRRPRTALWRYVLLGDAWTAVSAPFIYSLLVPLALLDGWVSLYQAICFRLWGLQRVRRRDYLVIDRHKLQYLNALEKLNCVFCGYANGVLSYVREVAARTEQYWCPIRHGRKVKQPHHRYADFTPYGDPVAYYRRLTSLRDDLRM